MAENMENKLPPRAPGKPPVNSAPPKPAPAAPKQPPKPAPAPKAPPTKPEAPKAPPVKPAAAPKAPPTKPEAPKAPPTKPTAQPEAPKQPPKPAPKPMPKSPEGGPPKAPETKPEAEVKPEAPKKEKAKKENKKANKEKSEPVENKEEAPKSEDNKEQADKPAEDKQDNKTEDDKVKKTEKPKKSDGEEGDKAEKKPKKPPKPKKEGADANNKNLNVVEKALSVEELNQLKQRRIRNGTYALAAVVLLLVIVLIVIIFWPTEERVEAQYDLIYNGDPIPVEHSIYSEEVTGNIITFKKPLTVEADSSMSGFSSFIMSVTFEDALGNDITDQMYIRLSENHLTDVYDYGSIRATVGEITDVPNHQFYVDLALHKNVYFTNPLAAGDQPFPVLLGFLCKNSALLADEIIMKVNLYGFNSETVSISYDSNGSHVIASDGTRIAVDSDWAFEVKQNAYERKFDN